MSYQYELTLVLRPGTEDQDEESYKGIMRKLIGEGTEIKEFKVIGKKVLAYPIAKSKEGVYLEAGLTRETVLRVDDLEKKTKQKNDILRYLLIRKR